MLQQRQSCNSDDRPSKTHRAASLLSLREGIKGLQVAGHLVGVSTSAKTPKGSAASFCRIGRAKAAVFPLPVCAVPSTSLPARMAGMQPCCTSVGFTMPREQHTLEATDSFRALLLEGILGHEEMSESHE